MVVLQQLLLCKSCKQQNLLSKKEKLLCLNKAKAVIHIFAGGAPSHLDTFDYKPEMKKFDGTSSDGGQREIFYTPFNFTPFW